MMTSRYAVPAAGSLHVVWGGGEKFNLMSRHSLSTDDELGQGSRKNSGFAGCAQILCVLHLQRVGEGMSN